MFQPNAKTRLCTRPLLALPLFLLPSVAHAQCDALLFDGSDDICTIPNNNNDFDFGVAMTVEAWVRVDQATAGSSWMGSFGGAWRFGASLGSGFTLLFGVSVPNTDSVTASAAINTATWQHFAGTYDGTDMKLYVDGVLAATKTHGTGGPVDTSPSIILGRGGVFPFHHNGAMDEVRIWNVVRTATEIQQTYNVALTGTEPGLVGYYKLDEGAGDAILDSSAAGNPGFLGLMQGADAGDPTRIPTGVPFNPCFGTSYCSPAIVNSSGVPGTISASGSGTVSDNDVTLTAADLPPNQFGYFLNSMTQASTFPVPGSQGRLCLGGAIGRYNATIFNSGSSGTGMLVLDLANTPTPSGSVAIAAGETWNWTCWYRDANPGPTSNFTDGISITFQ